MSHSVWMVPVDTSVEWPQTKILGLGQRFFMLLKSYLLI